MVMGRKLLGGMGSCALLALQPARALAVDEDCEWFGKKGQVVISSGAELSLGHTTSFEVNDSVTEIVIAPSMDVFVSDGFSVGGQVAVKTAFNEVDANHGLALGPRFGHGVPLSKLLSFHGTLGVAYSAAYEAQLPIEAVSADLFAPLLVHPAQHFFVGLGPHLSHQFKRWTRGYNHPRYTTYELQSVIGGYF